MSREAGGRSIFSLNLPTADAERASSPDCRVLLVDCDATARDATAAVLGDEKCLRVIAAQSADAALSTMSGPAPPDVAILSLDLPGLLELLASTRVQTPGSGMILTRRREAPDVELSVHRVLHAPLRSGRPVDPLRVVVLSNLVAPRTLLDAIAAVAPSAFLEKKLDAIADAFHLSASERSILSLRCRRLGAKDIAFHRGVSHRTVEKQLEKVYRKIGCGGYRELPRFLFRWPLDGAPGPAPCTRCTLIETTPRASGSELSR